MVVLNWYVSLLGAVAWPLSMLVIALLFRQEVKQALGRVGQFRYRDLEVTFRADLHQAETLARSIPESPSKSPILLEIDPGEAKTLGGHLIGDLSSSDASFEDREALEKLAARSPRKAIEEAWNVAGRALVRAAQALDDRRTKGLSHPDAAVRFLVDRGWLAGPEAFLVGLLRALKDRAARADEPPPSTDEARRYVDLALGVASRIASKS